MRLLETKPYIHIDKTAYFLYSFSILIQEVDR